MYQHIDCLQEHRIIGILILIQNSVYKNELTGLGKLTDRRYNPICI